ncbi:kynureninase [Jatrophihabitans sp.]|uniref:kynureninase n=1 Tax=Jatrophihabitans sp. TaxID=1932789 RepID=UPI0030C66D10|nr:kynU [Jatrophihabitans sp.]
MSEPTRSSAEAADAADPLAHVRARFAIPAGTTYLDGNSLGALPAHVPARLKTVIEGEWGTDLVTSWNANGWWELPVRVGDRIGALVGAAPGQVLCGDSTSVQLFQVLTALARLRPDRHTLITDGAGFPTDQYLADSVARLLGLTVVRVSPSDVESVLDDDVALVAFSAVDYRTGERWDAPAITEAVHAAGAVLTWDLAHAAGCMPFGLDEIGADAAVGCSYKYLNGGPGAPAWLYVAQRHQDALDLPLTGWQGHAEPFALEPSYRPAGGIERARVGTPPLLSMTALDAALDVFDDLDMNVVRAKSEALTQLVLDYAAAYLPGVTSATPADPRRRGSQVSLRLEHAYEVTQALIARGVIGDFRAPDLLRLGFAPLYLRHVEVWDALEILRDVLATESWRDPSFARGNAAVT